MKKRLLDVEFAPRHLLFIMTLVCIGMMLLTYFRQDTAIPIRTAVGYVVVPLQTGMNTIGTKLSDLADQRISMNQLLSENASLKEENELLKQQIALQENDQKQLNTYSELLEMKDRLSDYDVTGATIISRDSENWYQKFTIDKGTADGIQVNMCVVSGKGLVGLVTSVGLHDATVTSIIDDSMNVSAVSVTTKADCIVKGDTTSLSDGKIQIRYIDKDDTINEGDTIVTSQISGYYLPDILIGYATDITMDANMLTQSGYLVPAVDFSNLEEVLVITTLKNEEEE